MTCKTDLPSLRWSRSTANWKSSKSLKIPRLRQKKDSTPQVRLYNVYLALVHAHVYRYIATEEANGESNAFIIKYTNG